MRRENNIDFLRVIACILVILIHVTSIYLNRYSVEDGVYFLVGNLYDSFSRIAVPIFVILSGRYALSNKKNMEKLSYYREVFKKIYIPTIIWTFIYFFISYFFIYRSWTVPIRALLEGVPFYHMWYLYMSIALYLLTPYLIKWKETRGEKSLFVMGVFFLFLGMGLSFLQEYLIKIDFYNREDFFRYLKYIWYYNYFKFILYLGYFILGYSLKSIKISRLFGSLSYILMSLILFFIVQTTGDIVFYNYNFITTVIGSFTFYLLFNSLEIRYDISKIAKNTFHIYLIHAGVLEGVKLLFGSTIYRLNPLYIIPIITVFVFGISFIFSEMISRLKIKEEKNG